MEEINELDNKYLVIKWDDVRNNLSLSQRIELIYIVQYNNKCRERDGKKDNDYVVMNLDDEANIDYLIQKMVEHTKHLTTPYISIEELSIDLINAILIAGNP